MTAAKALAQGRSRWFLLAAAAIVLAGIAVYYADPAALWHELIVNTIALQRDLHRGLATAMRAVADHGAVAGWSLVGLSFLYGVFHAAGPGHGKAVVTTYLATQPGSRRDSLLLAAAGAMFQGITAILAVEIVVAFLSSSFREAQATTNTLEQLSFGLVAGLGALLLFTGMRRLWRRLGGATTKSATGCHHDHLPKIDRSSWWTALTSIGIRPCSGAILVLVLAHSLDLRLAGIGGVLAMSAGTALTVSLLALMTVYARDRAIRWAEGSARDGWPLSIAGDVIAILGGLFILGVGLSLLMASASFGNHPLF